MDCKKIKKLLEQYNIKELEELEYYLDSFIENNECIDDPSEEDKDCLNANCYDEWGVPSCRRLIEIYKKYFKKDIKSKKQFIEYLIEKTTITKSSAENYMSCKSLNQQIKRQRRENRYIQISFDIPDNTFKNNFCTNLEKKFSYKSLFERDYRSVKHFLSVNHEITRDNFKDHHPIKGEGKMTKSESDKLYNISMTSKNIFKKNLSKKENLIGSYEYRINLAMSAFQRGLTNESLLILNDIKRDENFQENEEFLQLLAKIFSVLKRDKEALNILRKLKEKSSDIIPETENLLAASIKRDAFNEFRLYGDDQKLVKELEKARDIYYAIYQLTKDYYPALNYIYIRMILLFILNKEKSDFDSIREECIAIWGSIEHKIEDWWSFISNIEYLILIKDYDIAMSKLEQQFNGLSKLEINDFNIYSTLRQLELYSNFCSDKELKQIIDYLKKLDLE